MPSAILPVSIESVPSLMACLIDSTCATSISAEPEAANARKCDDKADKLTFASPAEPSAPPVLDADVPDVLRLATGDVSPERAPCTPPLGDDRLELVDETTFTIGFQSCSI